MTDVVVDEIKKDPDPLELEARALEVSRENLGKAVVDGGYDIEWKNSIQKFKAVNVGGGPKEADIMRGLSDDEALNSILSGTAGKIMREPFNGGLEVVYEGPTEEQTMAGINAGNPFVIHEVALVDNQANPVYRQILDVGQKRRDFTEAGKKTVISGMNRAQLSDVSTGARVVLTNAMHIGKGDYTNLSMEEVNVDGKTLFVGQRRDLSSGNLFLVMGTKAENFISYVKA